MFGRVRTWLKQYKHLRQHQSHQLPRFSTASRSQTLIDGLRIRTPHAQENGSTSRLHIHAHILLRFPSERQFGHGSESSWPLRKLSPNLGTLVIGTFSSGVSNTGNSRSS